MSSFLDRVQKAADNSANSGKSETATPVVPTGNFTPHQHSFQERS